MPPRDEAKYTAGGQAVEEKEVPSYREPPKDPDTELEPEDELAAAKRNLLDAASCVDPLRSLRSKPLTTVGVAALVGVVLGWGSGTKAGATVAGTVTGTMGGAAKILGVMLKHAAPLVTTITNIVMAKTTQKQGEEMAQHAGQAAQQAAVAAGGSPADVQVPPPQRS